MEIILHEVFDYLDKPLKMNIETSVSENALAMLYDHFYLNLVNNAYRDFNGTLSQTRNIIRIFLFDIIKNQMEHCYISSAEYVQKIGVLQSF